MTKIRFALILFIISLCACEKEFVQKPDNLIREKQMIDMMVDLHLAETTYTQMRNDSLIMNRNSASFYYAILAKYQVPDSVFEKSYIYYASRPKQFGEMYQKVINKLSEIEQTYNGRRREEVNVKSTQTE
jgi:hypothetical protein